MSSIVNFQNTLYLIYADKQSATSTTSKLFYNTSNDNGVTWFNRTVISDDASNITYLNSKSAFKNNIHIVYCENVNDSGEKYYLTYVKGYLDSNGDLQFVKKRLHTSSSPDTNSIPKKHISIDVTRDYCHIVWTESNKIFYTTIDNSYEDSTIVVGDKVSPSSDSSALTHTEILSDTDNNLYLFYARKRTGGTNSTLKFVKFNQAFQSWSQPLDIVYGLLDQTDTSLSAAISPKDGTISLLYVATDLKVKAIFSINNGLNWSAPVTVFASKGYDYSVTLYSDCVGNLTAMAGAKSTLSPQTKDIILHSYSTDKGITWSTADIVERYDNGAYISTADDIKPYATFDEKLSLCVTYEEINVVELEEQNNIIFFKTVDGVYSPYVESAIPRVSISPKIINKDTITRSLTNPNIIIDANKQLFIYEYDSIFRAVTERKSTDYGNTWETQTSAFTVADDLNFLSVITDGSTKWAFYQLSSSGLNEIYARRKTTYSDEWETETKIFPSAVSPVPIPGTSELPLDVILVGEHIFVSVYYSMSSQDFIYTAVLDDDFTLIDSDSVQINIGAETEANGVTGISLDYYVDNNSPSTIGIIVAYNETYLSGSPSLTRKRIKTLNYKGVDLSSLVFPAATITTLDDNWADDDVPNSSYLMSPKVIIDKTIVNPIAHILYCKTTYDEELTNPEQVVYWAMLDVDTSTLIEYPTEVLAPEQNGTNEQVYFTEVIGLAVDSTDSNISKLHIYAFGDHISIFGTNYTGWASTAQYNIAEQERYRTNKKLQSGQTYAPVLTSKVISMLKDNQDSIHYVTTQYDDSAYGTTYYSKVISEDIPDNESLSLIPRPIGFEI